MTQISINSKFYSNDIYGQNIYATYTATSNGYQITSTTTEGNLHLPLCQFMNSNYATFMPFHNANNPPTKIQPYCTLPSGNYYLFGKYLWLLDDVGKNYDTYYGSLGNFLGKSYQEFNGSRFTTDGTFGVYTIYHFELYDIRLTIWESTIGGCTKTISIDGCYVTKKKTATNCCITACCDPVNYIYKADA